MQIKNVTITRLSRDATLNVVPDRVALESPLEIFLVHGDPAFRKTENLSVTLRTPGDDVNLVTGFLVAEGIINSPSDIKGIEVSTEGSRITIELSPGVAFDAGTHKRLFVSNSSCGYCGRSKRGKDTSDDILNIRDDGMRVHASLLQSLPASLRGYQGLFAETGGTHAVALADNNGHLLHVSEDVGRHNAMDKMAGAMFYANRLPLRGSIVLFSGRLGYELVQKCAVVRVPVICSIGAPTSLAIEIAEQNEITVIGFLKDHSFNIYSAPHRVIAD